MLRNPAITRLEKPGVSEAATEPIHTSDPSVISDANTALNIALFPPLFFFSALFYTDVMSTLIVLLSYDVFLRGKASPGAFSDFSTIIVGLVALCFRQTNIFWVAIFPAGLGVIDALKGSDSPSAPSKAMTPREVIQESWSSGYVHDCSVKGAGLQGISYYLRECDTAYADIC
jgi:alpha-1,2-glucosyltransferase